MPETYELQYSMDGTSWDKYESEITMKENGEIYARLLNELYEVVCVATGNVRNIDKKEPNEASITFSKNEIMQGETVTAIVSQSDIGGSGIAITKCKYAFTTTKTALGITDADLAKYTGTFKTETNDTINLSYPTAGAMYYLHVLTEDKAGNRKETVSAQGVKINKDTTPPNAATISFNTTSVTVGENVTATVSQSDSLSGIDIKNCKYAFTIGNTALGITDADLSKYTGSFKKETEDTLTLNCPKSGTYYLHVLSVDKVGNRKETISTQGVNSTKSITVMNGSLPYGWPSGVSCYYSNGCKWYTNNYMMEMYLGSVGGKGFWVWTVPALGTNATLTMTGATTKADIVMFGAGVYPSVSSVSSVYGSTTLPTVPNSPYTYANSTTYSATLSGIGDTVYVGFRYVGSRSWVSLYLVNLTLSFY